MKNLILISAIALPFFLSAQSKTKKNYVPKKFQFVLITESECETKKDSTNWLISIPFDKKNYIYEIKNLKDETVFIELSQAKIN
jgi:hypothetical protein